MMFQEWDWNDSTDAQALTKSLRVDRSSTSASQRAGVSPGVGRKKKTKDLLETLRVLECTSKTRKEEKALPAVKETSGSEDSATETAPVKSKRKKKRSKRRKQGPSSNDSSVEPQRLTQKRKSNGPEAQEITWKRKPPEDVTGNFKQEERSEEADVEGNAKTAAQLSRKQWKNKQKNKKKNKNKFKGVTETGVAPQKTEAENQDTRPRKQVATAALTKETIRLSKSSCSQLKENCSSYQLSSIQKTGFPTNSSAARTMPSGLKQQGSASDGNVGTLKLKGQKMAKLKKILQKAGKDALEGGQDGESGSPETATGENTEAAELEPSLPVHADRSVTLRMKMEERLKSARFRYINQQLYTSSSKEAQVLFQEDPAAFDIYHSGFQTQVQRWPENPVDLIIKYIRNRPASLVVADFGCGDCKISRSVRNTVHSFDLVALNELVTVCDMAKVPLADESVDIAVFCLALMGTNLRDFFAEANRILKHGGVLKIAEVASRFEDVRTFLSALANMGFKNTAKDTENSFFYMFEFTKTGPPKSKGKLIGLELKACLYKKR